MLFNSPPFLFLFFPCLYFFYRPVPNGCRNGVLLAASLFFYAWAEPIFVFWALGSAFLDWILGEVISRKAEPGIRKAAVTLGVIAKVALLPCFKYSNFFSSNLLDVLTYFWLAPSP